MVARNGRRAILIFETRAMLKRAIMEANRREVWFLSLMLLAGLEDAERKFGQIKRDGDGFWLVRANQKGRGRFLVSSRQAHTVEFVVDTIVSQQKHLFCSAHHRSAAAEFCLW
jgi:hypothetical protein